MDESPEISGLLYKKRGGFGKMMPNAWQYRFFTVVNGVLSYYDPDLPEVNLADNKPRGRVDMKAKKVEMYTNSPLEGAPTSYTIVLCPQNEEKWKLCATTKDDQFRWCHILEKYADMVIVVPSSNGTNSRVVYHLDEDNHNQAIIPTEEKVTVVNTSITNPTDLLVKEHSVIVREKKSGKKRLKSGVSSDLISQDTQEYIMALVVLNSCITMILITKYTLMRIIYLLIANYVVGYTIYLRGQRYCAKIEMAAELAEKVADVVGTNTTSSALISSSTASSSLKASNVTKDSSPSSTTTTHALVPGTTSPNIVTQSGAILPSKSQSNPNSSKKEKPIAGMSYKLVTTPQLQSPNHTWCKIDYRTFNVRVGPNYDRYKKKAPSAPALYEVFAVDIFCTKHRLDHATQKFQLPDTSQIDTHNKFVPPIFVVQLQMPADPPPSLFTTVEDGPGWAILMYFMITEDTCNQLKNMEMASPAVKLFAEYCEKAIDDPAWRARFKVIASCSNLEELGVPQVIASYNAKPVLIRRTGSLVRGPNYIEKDIHIYKFANLAKQSIHYLTSRCGLMYMQIGFVIEGRLDSELPEAIFGCCAVNKPQEDLAEFLFDD